MCKLKTVLFINTILFFLVGLAHLIRILMGWSWQISSVNIPLWPSVVAIVIVSCMVYLNLKVKK